MRTITTAIAALLVAGAVPLAADIVLLTNGRTMKVASYQADGDFLDLGLPTGGNVSLPLGLVERIVDDEVVPQIAVAAPNEPKSRVFPRRSWRYSESSRPLFDSRYDAVIDQAAKKFDVDAALVSAVIKAESDYNPKIVSRKGARGLMQLMPATAERFGVTNSFDPVANVHGGTRYLRWLLETFEGDADLAVAAYNAGEGNVWKYDGVPPFRETINYIQRIARHFRPEGSGAAVASSR